jgi:hypothetical protein
MRARQVRLHDIHGRGDQDVAAEGEDDGRGVQRPQATERQEREVEIEHRKGEFERDPQPDRESGDPPEHRRHGGELHRAHIVVRLAVDGQRRGFRRALEIAIHDRKDRRHASGGEQVGMERVFRRVGLGRDHNRKDGEDAEGSGGAALAEGHVFCLCVRLGHWSPQEIDEKSTRNRRADVFDEAMTLSTRVRLHP